MAKARSVSITIILIIAVIIILGGGGWYVYNQQTYVTSSDASVQGTIVTLSAPADGVLVNWHAPVGALVNKGAVIGRVNGLGVNTDFVAPITGTIIQNNAVDQEVVVPGEPVGYMVNLNDLQIVANVQETEINNVAIGKTVNISIDAYPNTTFTGTVTQIGSSSAVITNGVPDTNLNSNFNKQVQRVPVYISIQGTEGKNLVPGMNAEVQIDR
ncbi:MAG: efflux RND transporter periplasmic adaptor subunit [Firmicutes bacterium]|nr:efflux RND transporter periplasmic adaptor subunit [Bacillota bacterium]